MYYNLKNRQFGVFGNDIAGFGRNVTGLGHITTEPGNNMTKTGVVFHILNFYVEKILIFFCFAH